MDPTRIYSNAPCISSPKAFVEISVGALKHNYKILSRRSPDVRKICVVKADAYGHASEICVPALLEEGCDFFAVSCIEEAIAVRKLCRKAQKNADVLILGYTEGSLAPLLAEYDIIQAAVSRDHAIALAHFAEAGGVSVRVHVALDTGMNRIGVEAATPEECERAIDTVKGLMARKGLNIEGIFTHFARADEDFDSTDGGEFTKTQFERFDFVRKGLLRDGIRLFCHVSNSAATIRLAEYALDGVRIGIALYGVNPSPFVKADTLPVMALKTLVTRTNDIMAGETAGYGGAYRAKCDGKVATLPIGYADGFIRAFSGFSVTVHTKAGDVKAPVVGRVCMDQCIIDVSGADVEVEDTVTVFGSDPEDLSHLARMASTIEYEVLCLVSARLPRIVKEEG